MARARLRPSAYLTPPRPWLRERTASRDWRAQGRVDDERRAVSPPGSDWTAAAWAWRRRATDFSAPEAVAGPGCAAWRWGGRPCKKWCWSPGPAGEASLAARAAGQGSQEAGSTRPGHRRRPPPGARVPFVARWGLARAPAPLSPVPAAPGAGVRGLEVLSNRCWN